MLIHSHTSLFVYICICFCKCVLAQPDILPDRQPECQTQTHPPTRKLHPPRVLHSSI